MRVTLKAAFGVTVGLLVAGKVPDDQVLVATAREQHVGAKQQEISSESMSNIFFQHNILQRKFFPHSFPSLPVVFSFRTYFSKEVARQVTQPL